MATGTSGSESAPIRRAPMDSMRKAALWAGALYLLTFVSIPTVALYGPVKESGYVTGPGPDTGALVGGILELIVGLACIGTAVALYPVVKRQNEAIAMGFVGTRVLEAATIFIGVASLWTVVTLRQDGAGADGLLTGETLVAFYNRAFLVGQSFIPAVNALLLGSLLYQSRLVPRVLPVLGFIGAAALVSYHTATLFGLTEETAPVVALITVLPIATWEFGLGVYLVVRGFRPSAVAELDTVPAVPGTPWPGRFASQ
jgi:Domain of unknown function (DUF4386)